jgi:hypothetical protein
MRKVLILAFMMMAMITIWSCCLSSGNGGSGKWYYWLEPGAYAMYTFSDEEAPEIPGWDNGFSGRYNLVQLLNGTYYSYQNLTLTWTVLEVDDDRASVEYALVLLDLAKVHFSEGGPQVDVLLGDVLFSRTVWVKLDTLDMYDQDDLYLGRWPFWIRATELGTNITMVHNIFRENNIKVDSHYESGFYNITISLLDLNEYANSQNIVNPESKGLDTPYGFFSMNRLISWCATWKLTVIDNQTVYASQGGFPALYDKTSLVMMAYSHMIYVDDILLRIFTELRDGMFTNKPLVIRSTNIDFNPQEEQDEESGQGGDSNPFLLPALAVAACLSVGCVVYVWRKKSS